MNSALAWTTVLWDVWHYGRWVIQPACWMATGLILADKNDIFGSSFAVMLFVSFFVTWAAFA